MDGSSYVNNIAWSLFQKFGALGIAFICNIVLARLLMPEDFGAVAMLLIFVNISNSFIDGGFGSALIQKKEPTEDDYSTIFWWNISISVLLVVVLYLTAPCIADFYQMPILAEILRVISFVLVINALSVIQLNILRKTYNFKQLAIINIIATSASSGVAIICALYGWGVWSLVVRSILMQFITTTIVWCTTQWIPKLQFCYRSFKSLGNFGGMILLSSLVETIYTELQGLIIGKAFSARDLGFYTQAKKLEEVPTSSLSYAINQVTFPLFSSIQDKKDEIKSVVSKNVKFISFLVFPLYSIMILVAQPLITLIFTDRWADSIPLFQILCYVGMIYPLNTINTNIIKSLGKGKLYLIFQFSKRLIGAVILLLCIQFGIIGLMWAMVIVSVLILIANAVVTDRLIDYSFKHQIGDLLPPLFISIGVLYITKLIPINDIAPILTILAYSVVYLLLYLAIQYIVNKNELMTIIRFLKNSLYAKKNRKTTQIVDKA